jgi:hypothetical protein
VRLTVRVLGAEVLHLSTEKDSEAATGAPDYTTYPVSAPVTDHYMGFTNGREDEG